MKKILISICFTIAFALSANAQTEPTVNVPQSFVDDANQVFKMIPAKDEELKAAYILIGKLQAEKEAIAEKKKKLEAITCNEVKTTLFFIYKRTEKKCY